MKVPYTKSGKCGDVVWQRNRYGQICYLAFVPANPRTPSQMAGRRHFSTVSARWRTLTQEQRDVWIAVASTMKTKPRLAQCGVLTGFGLFIKVNVPLATQGNPQVDLPTEDSRQNKECIKTLPAAIPEPEPPTSNIQQPTAALWTIIGCSMFGVRGGMFRPLLRYRSCSIVPPHTHRSSTLAGRWTRRCPKNRPRFPCQSQPPLCRGAPAPY